MNKPLNYLIFFLTALLNMVNASALSIEQQVAQKLMIDLRYYCDEPIDENQQCKTPLTQLPKELAMMVSSTNLGGVILFSENLVDIEQIINLTSDLQLAAQQSQLKSPLLISIDQEGGRVARLPRGLATSFTGNMSIGATYNKFGTQFAIQSADVIATELKALGINVNHAPDIDVNMNPDNPVINVRSFGEDPSTVAKLGAAQVKSFQDKKVIATLKHFPGHGDTNVDSHTGLPVVNHDLNTIYSIDLLPFKDIIAHNPPGMIMTAHIQYPALDSSTFTSKDGEIMIKPATMSYKILTTLLRDELKYKGVVVTDALDMAGISHFFTPTQAVINTFKAGADIALMPIAIRNKDDIDKFNLLIKDIVRAVETGEIDKLLFAESARRISALKSEFFLSQVFKDNPKTMLEHAKSTFANAVHQSIERELARSAITLIANKNNILPLTNYNQKNIHLIMPDSAKCLAFEYYFKQLAKAKLSISCTSLVELNGVDAHVGIDSADLVIAGNISPTQSAVEMGGMDDLDQLTLLDNTKQSSDFLGDLLLHSKKANKKVIFISLRAPYDVARFGKYADAILASYAYNVDITDNGNSMTSAAFEAITSAILGNSVFTGKLPVTIATPVKLEDE